MDVPTKEELKKAYRRRKSVRGVAESFRVHPQTASQWFKLRFGKTAEQLIKEGIL